MSDLKDAPASLGKLVAAPAWRALAAILPAAWRPAPPSGRWIRQGGRAAGIPFRTGRLDGAYVHVGQVEGHRVTVRPSGARGSGAVAIEFLGRGALPYRARIDSRSSESAAAARGEIRTGDAGFDARIRLRGPRARTLAICGDAERRRMIERSFLEDGVTLERGRLRSYFDAG